MRIWAANAAHESLCGGGQNFAEPSLALQLLHLVRRMPPPPSAVPCPRALPSPPLCSGSLRSRRLPPGAVARACAVGMHRAQAETINF